MVETRKKRNVWYTILIVVAIGLKFYNDHPSRVPTRSTGHPVPVPVAPRGSGAPHSSGSVEKPGGYEVHRGCTLVENRQNDGDSFLVRLPSGKEAIFRLYFVDCPESAFRHYARGDTNSERIRQQAAEMGGITSEQAVEIGKQAKHFTLELLADRPFDLHTAWESPFHDDRYHAHVEVRQGGKTRWLDELLVERGLARIHTRGADLPDGTRSDDHFAHLRDLEKAAKRARAGVWSLR